MTIKNKVQLITYPDSLGGNLTTLNGLLVKHFSDVFAGGIHILPPFPSSGDRGFAPTTYLDIEPTFGTWEDIQKIGSKFDLMLDLMVNHISRHSAYFQDFVHKGRQSKFADMFITLDKVWPDGNPPTEDVAKIFLRKPKHPFSDIQIEETGDFERIWTTFGPRVDYAEQIDLDVNSAVTRKLFTDLFSHFSQQEVEILRLDAVGYVVKKPGTSCFMVEPQVYEFIDWLTEVADEVGLTLLPEVHDHYSTQFKLAEHNYWVYDFVLPALILHTLFNRTSAKIRDYLRICPRKQVTMLDCHDGIPIQPDLVGVVQETDLVELTDHLVARGANVNRILGAAERGIEFDAHQVNISYLDAAGGADGLAVARAVQLFGPGRPQVYYQGLLGGGNDHGAVAATGEGRAINRTDYSIDEARAALASDVTQRQGRLLEIRSRHPAFGAERPAVAQSGESGLSIRWEHHAAWCQLDVDLAAVTATVSMSPAPGLTDGPV